MQPRAMARLHNIKINASFAIFLKRSKIIEPNGEKT
jgi:hypothetical protein